MYEVIWNGAMDREETCGALSSPYLERTEQPPEFEEKHQAWKPHADRKLTRWSRSYQKAQQEVNE